MQHVMAEQNDLIACTKQRKISNNPLEKAATSSIAELPNTSAGNMNTTPMKKSRRVLIAPNLW
jgi:CheY-specific phosphatase CheX